MAFLRRSSWRVLAFSLHSHGASTAFIELPRRSHCVCTSIHGACLHHHNGLFAYIVPFILFRLVDALSDLSERPLRTYGVVGELTALLRRPRGDPNALLSGLRSHGVCFEHVQSARRRPAIYAISQRSMAIPIRCHGVGVALIAFPRRAGRRSGYF